MVPLTTSAYPQQGQQERDAGPALVKRDDHPSKRQVQKPVHERARIALAAEDAEELHPGSGLQAVTASVSHDSRQSLFR